MSDTNRPLWQVMHDAYWQAAGCEPLPPPPVAPECAAAEIRALTDWLVPEETDPPVEPDSAKFPWPPAYQAMSDAQWEMRQSLRSRLLAEADRAEAGE
jgi:hypothetical protein